jgi:PHP family Zn ribbon phosphoesterase
MTTPQNDKEIQNLKNRVKNLEKDRCVDLYAVYIADTVEHLSAFSSTNRLDAIKNHLEQFAKEITDINNR